MVNALKKLNCTISPDHKELIRLSVPNFISVITIPILGLVDTLMLGYFTEIYFIGAVALATAIFNFLYWGCGFLRMGTTSLTAQAYGANNRYQNAIILFQSICIAITASILIFLIYPLISYVSFFLSEASVEVKYHAQRYFAIRIYAAPATLCSFVIIGWLLGNQSVFQVMILTIITNIANIIFNIIFVYHFQMNSDGVAWGTVIAQYIGLIFAISILLTKYPWIYSYIRWKNIVCWKELKKILIINNEIFFRTFFLVFSLTYFTYFSARFGDDILAVNTIIFQIWLLASYSMDSLAISAEILTGKSKGSKNRLQLQRTIQVTFQCGTVWMVITTLILVLISQFLPYMFTHQTKLIELYKHFAIFTIIGPIISYAAFLWDGIFLGVSDTRTLRNAMFICSFVLYFPSINILSYFWGNYGCWIGLSIFFLSRSLILWWYARKRFSYWIM